jgi:UDP-N-acetylmuramoylalanine--D-glutamate ligase
LKELRVEEIPGKRVLVVGLGVSGFWAAKWLMSQGALVTVTEKRKEEELDPVPLGELVGLGAILELGGHREETFMSSDLIILSPGVAQSMAVLNEVRGKNIPVIGELELASRVVRTPVIAITGTNGKSTVTTCIGELLKNAGLEGYVCGNIGVPLTTYACGEMKADYVVVEVSSFQLDTSRTFCPYISVILNISPDHLDRYQDFEEYVQSKKKIFARQGPGQYLIVNNEDERLASISPERGVSVLRYGLTKRDGQLSFLEKGRIRVKERAGGIQDYPTTGFQIPGVHNILNFQAVVLVGHLLGIAPSMIQKTLDRFSGLPHRMERVGEIDGVLFYDDSKATNVDAAVGAIQSLDRPILLIAGGRHKSLDYGRFAAASLGKVKKAVFLGEARHRLGAAFHGVVPYGMAEDLDDAVDQAFSWASPGDVVLLAPACSSFDMFSHYQQRGEAFRRAVERLTHG